MLVCSWHASHQKPNGQDSARIDNLKIGMLDCKSNTNPLPSNVLSILVKEEPVDSSFNYQRGFGLLQYLVQCTQPNLAFAVRYLSQFLNNTSKTHQELVSDTI